MTFADNLAQGRVAEGWIARWIMSRGSSVLPAYEIEYQHFKGPQLFSYECELVAPDMITFTSNGIVWIEAKHKSVFTWHRKTKRWTTGVDLHHYQQYLQVAKNTRLPVWLLFFHRDPQPDPKDAKHGCPHPCPTGLFGGDISRLKEQENHRSLPKDENREGFLGHGKSGMVYWANETLTKLASKEEVLGCAGQKDEVFT